MKSVKQKRGMTLLEIIIAIAILGVLLASFLSMFTSGFSQIFKMGSKTTAVSDAQDIIETVYNAQDISDTFIQSIDPSENYEKVNDCAQIETVAYTGHRVIYCVGLETMHGEDYDRITVRVFYRNGNESVILSTIVP